jgi:hypothetical protein
MDQIEDAIREDDWKKLIHPVDGPLSSWKAIIVGKKNELDIRNGRPFSLDETYQYGEEYCRAYDLEGNFLAVLHFIPERQLWHPEKVFSLSQGLP